MRQAPPEMPRGARLRGTVRGRLLPGRPVLSAPRGRPVPLVGFLTNARGSQVRLSPPGTVRPKAGHLPRPRPAPAISRASLGAPSGSRTGSGDRPPLKRHGERSRHLPGQAGGAGEAGERRTLWKHGPGRQSAGSEPCFETRVKQQRSRGRGSCVNLGPTHSGF